MVLPSPPSLAQWPSQHIPFVFRTQWPWRCQAWTKSKPFFLAQCCCWAPLSVQSFNQFPIYWSYFKHTYSSSGILCWLWYFSITYQRKFRDSSVIPPPVFHHQNKSAGTLSTLATDLSFAKSTTSRIKSYLSSDKPTTPQVKSDLSFAKPTTPRIKSNLSSIIPLQATACMCKQRCGSKKCSCKKRRIYLWAQMSSWEKMCKYCSFSN